MSPIRHCPPTISIHTAKPNQACLFDSLGFLYAWRTLHSKSSFKTVPTGSGTLRDGELFLHLLKRCVLEQINVKRPVCTWNGCSGSRPFSDPRIAFCAILLFLTLVLSNAAAVSCSFAMLSYYFQRMILHSAMDIKHKDHFSQQLPPK